MSTQFGEKLRVGKKLAAFNAIRGIGRGGCYRGEGWQKVRMSARVPDAAATMWTSSLSKVGGSLRSPQVLYYKPSLHSALEAALIGGPPELG